METKYFAKVTLTWSLQHWNLWSSQLGHSVVKDEKTEARKIPVVNFAEYHVSCSDSASVSIIYEV